MPGTTVEAERFKNDVLLNNIQDVHSQFTLCTQDKLPDDCLLYLISLLSNTNPQPLHLSEDKWLEFLNFANNHWIKSLLYWKVCSLPEDLRPPKIIVDKMRMGYLLNAVNFFLPIGKGKAVASICNSVLEICDRYRMWLSEEEMKNICTEIFYNACELSNAVPSYSLHISLSGHFWEEIEKVIQ